MCTIVGVTTVPELRVGPCVLGPCLIYCETILPLPLLLPESLSGPRRALRRRPQGPPDPRPQVSPQVLSVCVSSLAFGVRCLTYMYIDFGAASCSRSMDLSVRM